MTNVMLAINQDICKDLSFFYFALFVPWQQTAENTFVFPLSNEEMPRKRSLDVSLSAEATNSLVQD